MQLSESEHFSAAAPHPVFSAAQPALRQVEQSLSEPFSSVK